MVHYHEIQCASACHRIKDGKPFQWDLNIYRGCEHGCKYCFAMYSHDYLEDEDYFGDIFVKTNIAEQLERQLRKSSWKREVINIGGVTDSYQPAEKSYALMPEILRLLIRYKNPCIISTKSDLILRDYELIEKLSSITYVNIAVTITAADENIQCKIEPESASSAQRFEVLKAFSQTNAVTALHLMPIIPCLTDTEDNIQSLFRRAAKCKVDYVLPCIAGLRGKTRKVFFSFIYHEFPYLYDSLRQLYKYGGIDKGYKNQLHKMLQIYMKDYGLSGTYKEIMEKRLNQTTYTQLSFLSDM